MTEPKITRRTALQAAAFGAVGAGLVSPRFVGSRYEPPGSVPDGTWPMAGRDPGRSGYAPGATGPTSEPTVRWRRGPAGRSRLLRSIAVGSDAVYVREHRGVVARDRETGTRRWRATVPTDFPGSGPAFEQVDAGPVVGSEAVYAGIGWDLHALDPERGRIEWHTSWNAGVESPILAGNRVYLSDDRGAAAIDAASGTRRARWGSGSTLAPLAVHGGHLVAAETRPGAGSGDPDRGVGVHGFPLRDADGQWSTSAGGAETSDRLPVACRDGLAFVGVDPVRAVDATDGRERWSASIAEFGSRIALAADGDALFVARRDPEAGVVALDGATGDVRWRRSLPVGVFAPDAGLALTDGALYVPLDGGVAALSPDDGEDLFRLDLGDDASVRDLAVTGRTLWVVDGSDEGGEVLALEP